MQPGIFEAARRVVALLAVAGLCLAVAAGCHGGSGEDGLPMRNTAHYAIVDTDRGVFVVELYPAVAPRTVENFETLTKKGFYDRLTFHRVEPGFVVQGGDPKGDGTGGPGYDLPAEIKAGERHLRGTVAMARLSDEVNPARRSSGSQFYVCLAPAPFLDGKYTIFAGVIRGMSVVDAIRAGDHIRKITLASTPPAPQS